MRHDLAAHIPLECIEPLVHCEDVDLYSRVVAAAQGLDGGPDHLLAEREHFVALRQSLRLEVVLAKEMDDVSEHGFTYLR